MNKLVPTLSTTESSSSGPVLIEAKLLGLAPAHLPTFRSGRYTGENERRKLSDFAPPDQELLRQIYSALLDLFLALKPLYIDVRQSRDVIERFVASGESEEMIEEMKRLGPSTFAMETPHGIERSIHDLRGGAFQALAFKLELFGLAPETHGVQTIFFLVRDHLKIMRNVVQDLDGPRFEADRSQQNHDAQLLVEKWSQAEFQGAGDPVHVILNCHYAGTLCESCLEFSTLDRIIYNLMNNAAKYTADGVVHFFMLPVGEDSTSVRFVFCNSVSAEHRRVLTDEFGGQLSEIFRGGFTTEGHGVGMRICADFCSQAYGLSNFKTAMEVGYFGAAWLDDQFTAWFHWPIGHNVSA